LTKPSTFILAVFIGGLVLQLGLLLTFQFSRQTALDQGRRIVVKAVPIDPRDLFRGDYVTLSYPFSRIERSRIQDALGDMNLRGVKVYVKIKQAAGQDTEWQAVAVQRRPFGQLAQDEAMLAAEIGDYSTQTLDLVYGCESFYVPEGEGKPIERSLREHKVTVELSVASHGEVQPVKLFVDGQQVEFK
jgi:uncharacterized membrane-anchored protein